MTLSRLALPALVAALLLLPSAPAAAPSAPAAAKAPAVVPADAKVTIPVGGMVCGGCVNTITTSLKKIEGVKAVDVDLAKKRAHVTYDAGKVTAKALVEAIREAGFEPGVPAVN